MPEYNPFLKNNFLDLPSESGFNMEEEARKKLEDQLKLASQVKKLPVVKQQQPEVTKELSPEEEEDLYSKTLENTKPLKDIPEAPENVFELPPAPAVKPEPQVEAAPQETPVELTPEQQKLQLYQKLLTEYNKSGMDDSELAKIKERQYIDRMGQAGARAANKMLQGYAMMGGGKIDANEDAVKAMTGASDAEMEQYIKNKEIRRKQLEDLLTAATKTTTNDDMVSVPGWVTAEGNNVTRSKSTNKVFDGVTGKQLGSGEIFPLQQRFYTGPEGDTFKYDPRGTSYNITEPERKEKFKQAKEKAEELDKEGTPNLYIDDLAKDHKNLVYNKQKELAKFNEKHYAEEADLQSFKDLANSDIEGVKKTIQMLAGRTVQQQKGVLTQQDYENATLAAGVTGDIKSKFQEMINGKITPEVKDTINKILDIAQKKLNTKKQNKENEAITYLKNNLHATGANTNAVRTMLGLDTKKPTTIEDYLKMPLTGKFNTPDYKRTVQDGQPGVLHIPTGDFYPVKRK